MQTCTLHCLALVAAVAPSHSQASHSSTSGASETSSGMLQCASAQAVRTCCDCCGPQQQAQPFVPHRNCRLQADVYVAQQFSMHPTSAASVTYAHGLTLATSSCMLQP